MKSLVSIDKVEKRFGKKTVLDGVSLQINKGDVYGLVGNNGAGKTTLMRIICGFESKNGGEIRYDKDLRIGSLIETPGLFGDMSAYSNLKLKAIADGIKFDKTDGEKILKTVGLENVGRKLVRKFSYGMKQRLGLATALLGNPDLVILDEPINGLDPEGINDVRNIIIDINKKYGTTFLISSHILDELMKVVDRFVIIKDGKVARDCTKEEFEKECNGEELSSYYVKTYC